jgi:hypothetical protein
MGLNVKRSDLFPVGTAVKAFGANFSIIERTRGHKPGPSAAAVAEATVDAFGNLAFPTLGEGQWELWAEVAGVEVNLHGGSENFVPSAVTPGALTFNSGLLNKRGAVTAGVPAASVGSPTGPGVTTSGAGVSDGIPYGSLAERIQAKRAFDGCAPNSLAPLI